MKRLIVCPHCYIDEYYDAFDSTPIVPGTQDVPLICDMCGGMFLVRRITSIAIETFKLEVVGESNIT